MKKAVIWDMDGVLVDTGPYHLRAWMRFWHELGVPYEPPDFWRTFGQRNDILIPAVLNRPITPAEVAELAQRKERYFREEIGDNVSAMPGTLDLLDSLAANGFRQALATSAPAVNANFLLDRLGIREKFQAVVMGQDVTRGKPNPDIFLFAADRLQVEPTRCVVFEDSIAGVTAAKAAGMVCVATLSTSTGEQLAAADLIVPDLRAVTPAMVDELLRRSL